MTTLVALATKDALVMGCDSLGSAMKPMIDPFNLAFDFFDSRRNWKLKVDKQGKPILKEFNDVYKMTELIPYNQMTHVTKMFSFHPLEMGVMTTGISSIGARTIKSLINEFKGKDNAFSKKSRAPNYTVKSIGNRFLNFISKYYEKEYSQQMSKPALEFMIGGYDKQKPIPTINRIYVHTKELEAAIEGGFGIAFGGQMQEIQRLVFGTDNNNRAKLISRINELLEKYRKKLDAYLKRRKCDIKLPEAGKFGADLDLFKDWDLNRFATSWGDFSEQNAIYCVHFFVEVMIRSQQFCSTLPTVGGDVHIALINKEKGFIFISREEYEHEGFTTPIKE